MLRRFSIVPLDLRRIDTLNVDAIVLPLFQEVMQPQGVAGYFDWRLCGRLGRLIQTAEFSGVADEIMLLSYAARVGPKQLFLYGLGPPKIRSAARCCSELERIFQVLSECKAKSVALAMPDPYAVETFCHWIQAPELIHTNLHEILIMDADKVLEDARVQINPLLKKAGLQNPSVKSNSLWPRTSCGAAESKKEVSPNTNESGS